jgi:hypothetical protein
MSTKNILAVYHLANVGDRIEGASWYGTAKKHAAALADQYGIHIDTAAGVIAALSPRNKWERNLADAENLIRVFTLDPQSVDSVKVCTFGANKAKAIKILEVEAQFDTVLDILSGPKLREFFTCIIGDDTEEVCVDGHAYSIWAGDRITLANVPSIGVKLRRQIKADYAAVAEQLGLPAYVVQAITWCAWRRINGVA